MTYRCDVCYGKGSREFRQPQGKAFYLCTKCYGTGTVDTEREDEPEASLPEPAEQVPWHCEELPPQKPRRNPWKTAAILLLLSLIALLLFGIITDRLHWTCLGLIYLLFLAGGELNREPRRRRGR